MTKVLAIDPGISKCGIVIADIELKKVSKAIVIKSKVLLNYVRKICQKENLGILIGNGTSSKKYISALSEFTPNLIIAEEKNSTFRAKERYFEMFPIKGLKKLLPREVFILNKNLDALAALIIMEDYYKYKFEISNLTDTKTWQK